MRRSRTLSAAAVAVAIAIAAATVSPASMESFALASAAEDPSPVLTRYGTSVALGEGRARTYVTLDQTTGVPIEIGVAFDERALDGLPSTGSGHHSEHMMMHAYLLDLPTASAAPFEFVELNWNPAGHEPTGVYEGAPHFDFHFYTISREEREAIVPSDPQFAAKANKVPGGDLVPPHTAILAPPGAPPAAVAVPMMGVHWVDVRSPELQGLLGNPDGYRPFTSTFIIGSWDGRYHFWEPMITRAHILEKRTTTDPAVRDEIIPIPIASRYEEPGHYPTAYRIAWDPEKREYRVALTGLTKR